MLRTFGIQRNSMVSFNAENYLGTLRFVLFCFTAGMLVYPNICNRPRWNNFSVFVC